MSDNSKPPANSVTKAPLLHAHGGVCNIGRLHGHRSPSVFLRFAESVPVDCSRRSNFLQNRTTIQTALSTSTKSSRILIYIYSSSNATISSSAMLYHTVHSPYPPYCAVSASAESFVRWYASLLAHCCTKNYLLRIVIYLHASSASQLPQGPAHTITQIPFIPYTCLHAKLCDGIHCSVQTLGPATQSPYRRPRLHENNQYSLHTPGDVKF